jgi:hypothetical protein
MYSRALLRLACLISTVVFSATVLWATLGLAVRTAASGNPPCDGSAIAQTAQLCGTAVNCAPYAGGSCGTNGCVVQVNYNPCNPTGGNQNTKCLNNGPLVTCTTTMKCILILPPPPKDPPGEPGQPTCMCSPTVPILDNNGKPVISQTPSGALVSCVQQGGS